MPELPLKTLAKFKGNTVTIRLKSNIVYKGRLEESDNMMNIILEDSQELEINEDGKMELKKGLGRVFVRGNNILLIQLDELGAT